MVQVMTNDQAYKRALIAIRKALKKDPGADLATHDLIQIITDELQKEFSDRRGPHK